MWWTIIFMGMVLLYPVIEEGIDALRSHDPNYQKKKEQELVAHKREKAEVLQQLKEEVGNTCLLESEQFYLLSKSSKIEATILQVTEEWLEFSLEKKDKSTVYIFKACDINNVSKIVE